MSRLVEPVSLHCQMMPRAESRSEWYYRMSLPVELISPHCRMQPRAELRSAWYYRMSLPVGLISPHCWMQPRADSYSAWYCRLLQVIELCLADFQGPSRPEAHSAVVLFWRSSLLPPSVWTQAAMAGRLAGSPRFADFERPVVDRRSAAGVLRLRLR